MNKILQNQASNVDIEHLTILDLPKLLKLAREHSILGFYETSLKKYNQVLALIQKRQSEISDSFP